MAILNVNYDLYKEPTRAYTELFAAIQSAGYWCHPVESTWYVQTAMSPQDMMNHLSPRLHQWDKVIVTPVAVNTGWWSRGLSNELLDWFRAALSPNALV